MSINIAFSLISIAILCNYVDAFWRMGCTKLEISRIDSIVQPQMVSNHVHTTVGGSNFGVNATGASLLESYCTSCELNADRSAYWTPLLYYEYPNGSIIDVSHTGTLVYYLGRGTNSTIHTFPPGFRMVAGDAAARSYDSVTMVPSGNTPIADRVSWLCITSPPTAETAGFNNINCPFGLRAQITFPTCWNGVDLYKSDQSHVQYLTEITTGSCPSTHPYQIMQIFMEVLYSVNTIPQVGEGRLVLSTGDPTGYSFHADFQNAWDETVLTAAIAQCNSSLDSGVIDECPPLKAVHETDTDTSCPYRNSQVQEQTTGLLPKIPGCIEITEGPARAAAGSMSCPSGVTPPVIIPTQDSQVVIKKTVMTGQPFGLSGYVYMGCSNDSAVARVLGGPSFVNTTGMTVEACQQYCSTGHQKYSGVEFGQECYCGNFLNNYPLFGNGTQFSLGCYFTCTGDDAEYCGGRGLIDIYNNLQYVDPPVPTIKATASGGYISKGCYKDLTNGVRLLGNAKITSSNMTPDLCGQTCSSGSTEYRIMGVQFSSECYCASNMISQGETVTSQCNMLCSGNNGTNEWYCGGPSRINLYYNAGF